MKRTQWSQKIQVDFFEILGQLLLNGYALERALHTLPSLLPKQSMALQKISQGLREGRPFAQLLQPYVRKEIYRDLMFADIHGRLASILIEIGKREYRRLQIRQKLHQILYYPMILFCLVISAMVGFSIWLLPEFKQLGLAQTTVLSDEIIIGLVMLVLSGLVLIGLGYWRWRRTNWLVRLGMLQRLPLIGKLIKLSLDYQICLQLGLLLTSGISLATIIQQASHTKNDQIMMLLGQQARQACHEGQNLWEVILNNPLLPRECQLLFAKGKPESEVGEDLQVLAQRKFELLERLGQRYLLIVQPVCFAVVGVIVLGMYMLLLMPMYQNMGELMTW